MLWNEANFESIHRLRVAVDAVMIAGHPKRALLSLAEGVVALATLEVARTVSVAARLGETIGFPEPALVLVTLYVLELVTRFGGTAPLLGSLAPFLERVLLAAFRLLLVHESAPWG